MIIDHRKLVLKFLMNKSEMDLVWRIHCILNLKIQSPPPLNEILTLNVNSPHQI